jgi:riboflavin biosynthesis pyrimidine reductase
MTPDTLRTAADVSAYADWLFGRRFEPRPGLVHVASVHVRDSVFYILHIRDDTPRSPHDACMLRMARARADAIVTTGRVLRAEPRLRHELSGSSAAAAVLQSWGDRVRGRATARVSIVLTRGRAFAPDHPLVTGSTDVVIACPRGSADSLRERFGGRDVDVVGLDEPTVAAVVQLAKGHWGAETVLLEAGPATVGPLYDDGAPPNELMLAEFRGGTPPHVRGGRLVHRQTIIDGMGPLQYGPTRGPHDELWRFAWLQQHRLRHAV